MALYSHEYSMDQEDLVHLQKVGAIIFSEERSIGSIASTSIASIRTTQSTRDKLADALKKQEEAEQRQAETEARLSILEALVQGRKTATTTPTPNPNPDEETNREEVESSSVTLSKEQREDLNQEEVSSSVTLSKERREEMNHEEVVPSSVTLSKKEEEMNHEEVGSSSLTPSKEEEDKEEIVSSYTISNLAKTLGISKTQFEKIISILSSFPGKQNFNCGDDLNASSFPSDLAATIATVRDGNIVSSKGPSTKNQVQSGAHGGVVSDYKPDLLDYIFDGSERAISSFIHKINDTNDNTKLDHMFDYLFDGGFCGATADRFACGPMQDSNDEFDGYNSPVCSSMHFMEGEEEDRDHHLCKYTTFPCSTNNNLQQHDDDDQEYSLEDFDGEVLKQATLSSSCDQEEQTLRESPSAMSTEIKTGGHSTKMVLLQYNSSSEEDEASPIPSPQKLTIVDPDDLSRMDEDEDGDGDDANIEGLRKSLREPDFQFRSFLGGILDNVANFLDTSIEVEESPKSGEPGGNDSDDDGDLSWYMKTYANDPEKLKVLLDAKKFKDEARNPSVEKKSKNMKDPLKALLTDINPDLERKLKEPFACINPDFENALFDNDDDDRQAEASSLSESNGGEGGASVENSASLEDSINTQEDVPTTFCGCYKPSLRHEATKKGGKKKLSLIRESRSEKPGVPTKFLQQNRSAFLKKKKRRRRRQSQRKSKPKKLLLSYE